MNNTSLQSADDTLGRRYLEVCIKALEWAEDRDYTGYSKFDALNSPLIKALSGEHRLLRGGFTYLVSRSPFNIRGLIGVQKRQNPKALALFARTYFNLYKTTNQKTYLEKGLQLLSRLEELSQYSRYNEHCWGYCHDWQTYGFFIAAHDPNSVVTTGVAHAFIDGYDISGNESFLSIARSSARFLRSNLNVTLEEVGMKAYSYSPFDRSRVINTNALLAALFARVHATSETDDLANESSLISNFVLDRQTDEGGWYHSDPSSDSKRKIDNYQIGFILESLKSISGILGHKRIQKAYEHGLEFYGSHLFLRNGAPKFESHHKYPYDIIGSSQGIISFSQASTIDPAWLDKAERTAQWAVSNMWDPSGRFYFQKTGFFIKKYTLMRWCQAWMCYALSVLIATTLSSNNG